MKAIGLVFISLLGARTSPGELRSPVPQNGRLKAAIARALAQNPDLRAMEARIGAARARVPQASAFPDPEVEVGIKDIPPSSFSLSRDDFTMEMVTARQSFPGFGKRAGRKASAEAAARSVDALHRRHATDLAADVADSFYTLADLDRRLEILEGSRERLKQTAAAARERYRVGRGPQSDVLRANLEATSLEDRLSSLRAERRSAAARFNALQDLAPDVPVDPVGAITPPAPGRTEAEILKAADETSPAVAAARASVQKAEQDLNVAKLERRPDWMLSAYYGHRERFEDLAGASVSLNLPFAHPRRLEERRAEMEAELSAARADLESVRNELRRSVEEAAAALDRDIEQERLYRTSILPQGEINFRAAEEAYAVGQIDFTTFERAALDLDSYEAEIAVRTSGIGRAVASLQKASGLPLIEGTPEFGENDEEK